LRTRSFGEGWIGVTFAYGAAKPSSRDFGDRFRAAAADQIGLADPYPELAEWNC
jgi:hypothetical protein